MFSVNQSFTLSCTCFAGQNPVLAGNCIKPLSHVSRLVCPEHVRTISIKLVSRQVPVQYLEGQMLEASSREGHRGHEQGHITLLPTQPAPLVEEVLKKALHLKWPLEV